MVILTSSYGHEKRDAQIQSVPFRYVATQSIMTKYKANFESLSWIPLEPKHVDFLADDGALQIPGGGFAKSFFDKLNTANIPCVILLKFCSEGDNIPDALELANYVDGWLHLFTRDNGIPRIKYPPSWKFLFGNAPPREIY